MKSSYSEREYIRRINSLRQTAVRIRCGWDRLVKWYAKLIFILLLPLITYALYGVRHLVFGYSAGSFASALLDYIAAIAAAVFMVIIGAASLLILGTPPGAGSIHTQLTRIGFTNTAGDTPQLLQINRDPKNSNVLRYRFSTPGIPLDDWKKYADELSSALNLTIIDITYGKTYSEIIVTARKGKFSYPAVMPWEDKLLLAKDCEFLLGVNAIGLPVIWDCGLDPHAIIAGATGSGKTMLQALIAHQALLFGHQLLVIDYKGSADWARPCFGSATIVDTPEETKAALDRIMDELSRRKQLLRNTNARNIDEYREKTGDRLPRVMIAIDETADVLCAAPDKSKKELYDNIRGACETLTRQGRSLGIHLVYGIQRPDMTLSGQIRSNCIRFCGRADDNLRRVVFGDAMLDATETPPEKPGEFLTSTGEKFLAYYYNK